MAEDATSKSRTWRVYAETNGMLTLPPDRPFVQIGNVEVALRDDRQASAESRAVITSWASSVSAEIPGIDSEPLRSVGLVATTVVEAPTGKEAIRQGCHEIETALTVMMLASGGQIAPACPVCAIEESPTNGEIRSTLAVKGTGSVVKVWSDRCEALVLPISERLAVLSDEDARRLRVALHWWRRSSTEAERHTLFVFQWFALEALASMSFSFTSKPPSTNKGQHLLVTKTGLWSAADFQSRYRLRCAVAHGDTAISLEDEEELEACVDPQHAAIQCIIHVIINCQY